MDTIKLDESLRDQPNGQKRPRIADTLVWCSAVEDNLATRSKEEGSWFIQNAFQEIMDNPDQGMDVTMKNVTALAKKKTIPVLMKKDNSIQDTFPIPCVTHDTRAEDIFLNCN